METDVLIVKSFTTSFSRVRLPGWHGLTRFFQGMCQSCVVYKTGWRVEATIIVCFYEWRMVTRQSNTHRRIPSKNVACCYKSSHSFGYSPVLFFLQTILSLSVFSPKPLLSNPPSLTSTMKFGIVLLGLIATVVSALPTGDTSAFLAGTTTRYAFCHR